MNHLEVLELEIASENSDAPWLKWVRQVKILADLPDLDGNNSYDAKIAGVADGYSLDDALEAFEAGKSAAQHAEEIKKEISCLMGA